MSDTEAVFTEDFYGLWRQVDPRPFDYTIDYKSRQSTTRDMSMLRMGWLGGVLHAAWLRRMQAVDVGCGNRVFIDTCSGHFRGLAGYDLAGESISKEELESTDWDLMIMSDVIEHMPDMEAIFELKWSYLYLSFPETPEVADYRELRSWRHYKPNEHVWMLNSQGMISWFNDHQCATIASGHPEDIIRRPPEGQRFNVASMVLLNLRSYK